MQNCTTSIPQDVLLDFIIPLLDATSTARLACVSREMYAICSDDIVWFNFTVRDFRWAWDWPTPPSGPFIQVYGDLALRHRAMRTRRLCIQMVLEWKLRLERRFRGTYVL